MKDKEMLISICITSYNRVRELERLLNSIDCYNHVDDIEIIVSEDKSPRKEEISSVVSNFIDNTPFKVVFNTNEQNLGYDRNLGKLKSLANGIYIIYMSDDDVFIPKTLDNYIDFLKNNSCEVCFQPFVMNRRVYRKYPQNTYFDGNQVTLGKHIYDSILFSGLTFKRDAIIDIDAEKFLNTYYFQVFMFMTVGLKYGIHYYNEILIDSVCDGENGYGLSDSSEKNSDLADRNSVFSDLEFNKGLLKVIGYFDKINGTSCKSVFAKEYSLRTLPGMLKARRMSKDTYKEYVNRLEGLDIDLTIVYKFYKYCINVLGVKLTSILFAAPRKMLFFIRKGGNA